MTPYIPTRRFGLYPGTEVCCPLPESRFQRLKPQGFKIESDAHSLAIRPGLVPNDQPRIMSA